MTSTRIFAIAEPWVACEANAVARKQKAKDDKLAWADRMAGPEVYRSYYDKALKRLEQLDMLPLHQASARMNATPEALLRKADRGQLVLIELEGVQVVPDWILDSRGRVKPFHLAIAKEFSESGQQQYFKFMSYLKFMSEESLEFRTDLPRKSMKDVFRAVGIKQGACHVHVRTPMFEAADRALKNRVILAEFINRMGAALTRIGGMGNPNEGGLSEEFRARYIPVDLPGRDNWKREFLP